MHTYDRPSLQIDAIGNHKHGDPNYTRGFVFGRRVNIDNTEVDLWEGPTDSYVFPTSAMSMRIVSSGANDSSSGTGIQQVLVHYLDNDYLPQITTVTLNGTTPVTLTPTNILRINNMHASAVGSGGVAAGNISLTNTAGTVTYGYITAGFNTARQAIYTVPAGVVGYISHWQCSSGSTSGNHFTPITLRATTHAGILFPGVFLIQDEHGTQDQGTAISFPIPIRIPAKTDVKISAISDTGTANVTAYGTIMGVVSTGIRI